MKNLIEIAQKYYIILIIISSLLVLALIGYIADKKSSRDVKIKKKKENSSNIDSLTSE